MARYDLDNLLTDIGLVLTDNLNTKIADINTEKGDSLLTAINSEAFFKQTLRLKTINYDPYIFYGITDIENESDDGMPLAAENVTLHAGVVVRDDGTNQEIVSKMLRYQRALKETFEDNWENVNNSQKLIVSSTAPIGFERLADENDYRVMGVEIKTTLA